MKFLKLIRIADTEQGTFGVLKINETPFCVTLEPKDRENKSNVSCIPIGQYEVVRHSSAKYGNTWKVKNVPDRKYILFHGGNTSKHTRGCILLAEHYGKLYGDLAVLNSGKTFKAFKTILELDNQSHLSIYEQY